MRRPVFYCIICLVLGVTVFATTCDNPAWAAHEWDGSSSNYYKIDNPDLGAPPDGDFTIICRVDFDSLSRSSNVAVFAYGTETDDRGFGLYYDDNGDGVGYSMYGVGGRTKTHSMSTTGDHLIGVVHQDAWNYALWYDDDEQDAGGSSTGNAPNTPNSTDDIFIGFPPPGVDGSNHDGGMQWCALWYDDLTDTEVQALEDGTSCPDDIQSGDLKVYVVFEDGESPVDNSTNEFTVTEVGTIADTGSDFDTCGQSATTTTTTSTTTTSTTTTTTTSTTTTTTTLPSNTDLCGDSFNGDPSATDNTDCPLADDWSGESDGLDSDGDGYADDDDCAVTASDTTGYFGSPVYTGSVYHAKLVHPGDNAYYGCSTPGEVKECLTTGWSSCTDESSTGFQHPDYTNHKYVAPWGEDDASCGSFSDPCLTPGTLGEDYLQTAPATNNEAANDTAIYLRGGTYQTVSTYSSGNVTSAGIFISGKTDIIVMSYPGEIATIDCQGDETTVGVGVRNGTRVNVRGIEIRGCDIGIAYYDESGHSGLVEDNYIHSTDGTAANNPAGVIVYNGHDGLDVKHNLFEDNYDREGAVNENNSNIYYSQGMCNATYPVEIAYNTIITSLNSVQTAGIKFKHIDSGGCTNPSQADIHHNIVMGGAGGCIVSAAGDHIYRNICYNTGVCFWMGEHGGSNDIDDLLLEYNTCVPRSGSVGIYLDGDGDEDFDDITERYNIWHTNHTASGATAIFNVNHNGSSGEYSDLSGLDFDNSTYYNNGGTIAMSVYGGLDSARIYEGSTEWNAANDNGSSTGYGDAGYFGDPQLDVAGDITLEPSNANSTSHGVFASGASTTTTTTSTSTTSTSTSTTSTSTSTTSTTTSTSTSTTTTTLPTTTTTTTLVPPENQGKRFPIGRGRGFGKYRRAEVWKYGQN